MDTPEGSWAGPELELQKPELSGEKRGPPHPDPTPKHSLARVSVHRASGPMGKWYVCESRGNYRRDSVRFLVSMERRGEALFQDLL